MDINKYILNLSDEMEGDEEFEEKSADVDEDEDEEDEDM